ncbi:DeoR/GlpR family DNA-binding transcription regulator [Ruminococcus gauvreauii]|uniref:Lactose phosphotransferase system repressor n=1 Tax=Ruminococcus gauvreauii TaxID=438033 RepID=A0ABY5VDI2_9FIRM|nr:DeoR/GlpR family DNA-binding transcription regulator [Ruminococcus gauvreauii]UWP58243.1 DeoR/GlpR family DNA-binding transcription regulator [Ruminococcus gauvreauii]
MTVSDRRREISDLLLQKGKVKVGDLARRFQVSTETIRKDLLELEAQGFIKKNKGSAEVLVETSASAYSRKSEKFIETKKKIAREAARLIPSHSVIFIDAGSTNYQLARQLIMRKDIIVVTNFTPIAELMNANEIKVILIGGEIRQVSGATTGMLAAYCIDHVHADLAFLGTSGFLDSSGPCVENFPEADVKRRMLQNAAKSYVLADSSKASTKAIVKYAEWSEITGLLTDDQLDCRVMESLEKEVNVITVNTEEKE